MIWLCRLFHRWGKWSETTTTKITERFMVRDVLRTYECKMQTRACLRCNETVVRLIEP